MDYKNTGQPLEDGAARAGGAEVPQEGEAALRKRVREQNRIIRFMRSRMEHLDSLFSSYSNLSLIMAEQMERNHSAVIRQNRLRRDLNNVASMLMAADTDSFERVLQNLLRVVCTGLGASRMTVWRNHRENDGLYCSQLYQWAAPSAGQYEKKLVTNLSYDRTLPGWEDSLFLGRSVNVTAAEMPMATRNNTIALGITSILAVPIRLRAEFWGFVGLAECLKERRFTEDEEGLMRSASLLIGNAILHNEMMHGLMEEREKALSASRAKSQFLATMSHEIRTPMNAIIGMSDLMRIDNLDETQLEYLSGIKRMSGTLLSIIDDILDFSKIESGKMDILPGNYDLFAMYDNICSIAHVIAADKPLQIEHSIDENLPRALFGDEVRVRQIIMNLLNNAIKYTPEGSVRLRLRQETADGSRFLGIVVQDTGIGIRKENQEKIFQAFVQVDREKNREVIGTGLGLSITKRLVDLMEGEIFLESEYGRGTAFTVRLPLIVGDENQVEHEGDARRIMVSPQARILVVDDNAVNLTVALGFLARHGVRADSAESGAEAIRKICGAEYDLVFMDHMMPGMDGIEATQRLRAMDGEYYAKLPIVALSANAVLSTRMDFFQAGMNDFIAKPIADIALGKVLAKWLPARLLLAEDAPRPADEPAGGGKGSPLPPLLAKIPDLDVAAGLRCVGGNTSIYLDILLQFCKGLDSDVADILSFAEKADWNGYTVRLHALKSVFANFGNLRLRDWALALEKASAKGDTGTCLAQSRDFCAAMEEFRERVREAAPPGTPAAADDIKSIGIGAMILRLERLERACFEFNTEEAELLAAELRRTTFNAAVDARLTEIIDLATSLDYAEAGAKCGDLLRMLR